MPVPLRLALPCLIAVAMAAAGGAQAQSTSQGRSDQGRGAQQGQWPRSQDAMGDSIRRVRSEARGQVLSAERMHMDGREINRIKVMDDRGRVRVYEDDPQQRGTAARPRTRSRDD
ncbi:hypothetical protein [Luteimonas sp. YGD11-2]|uniref:hypothetical protein n=1 Tax=Luteimonas sp. YGD11-2 TaxID=2508168 RepID=UPI001F504882|nr:hypothetical protein [Luteimonas sp. YGD11-2]